MTSFYLSDAFLNLGAFLAVFMLLTAGLLIWAEQRDKRRRARRERGDHQW